MCMIARRWGQLDTWALLMNSLGYDPCKKYHGQSAAEYNDKELKLRSNLCRLATTNARLRMLLDTGQVLLGNGEALTKSST